MVLFLAKQQSPRNAEVESRTAGPQATTGRADEVAAVEPNLNTRRSEAEPQADNNDAVYQLSPPKAAFYVEEVKGFGEWKVNVTDNANTEFRKLRKRSPETLRLVLKKVKWVFQGLSIRSPHECSLPSFHSGTFRAVISPPTIKFSFPTQRMRCRYSRRMLQGTLA